MAFKNVFITKNNTRLSVKNNQLFLQNQDTEGKIPLEDICSVTIDPYIKCSFNSYVLQQFANFKVGLFVCDNQHLPSGAFLPNQRHTRQKKRLEKQLNLTLPFKKQIWQQIIKQKINNQAECLKLLGLERGSFLLKNLAKKVKSGDSTNIEAIASSQYFVKIFNYKFSRNQEIFANACLNYGYSILRSNIAKYIVSYGFISSLGIFHKNEYNNFNLADDFIEPFRPVVDYFVLKELVPNYDYIQDLTPGIKQQLQTIPFIEILHNSKKTTVLTAVNQTLESYVTCINKNDVGRLNLPILTGCKYKNYA